MDCHGLWPRNDGTVAPSEVVNSGGINNLRHAMGF
jgi:hypothetical protein